MTLVADRERRAPVATQSAVGLVAVVAMSRAALQLSVAGRYGWHRDELYFLATTEHLDWGYVDIAPMLTVVARVARATFGSSLFGLHVMSVTAGVLVVLLAGDIARHLGADRRTQIVAAIAVAATPHLLGAPVLFQTVPFDDLWWAATSAAALRALRRSDARSWICVGALAGLGALNKYTFLVLPVCLGAAVLATPRLRHHLRPALLGAGVAGLLVAPHVVWQVATGAPSLEYFTTQRGAVPEPLTEYAGELLLTLGPVAAWLVLIGTRALLRDHALAPLGWLVPASVAAFAVTGGRAYYAAPSCTMAIVAGVVAVARLEVAPQRRTVVLMGAVWGLLAGALMLGVLGAGQLPATAGVGALLAAVAGRIPLDGPRLPSALAALAVTAAAIGAPLVLPVLPRSVMVDAGVWELREDFADELGWPELVDAVVAAHAALPPDAGAGVRVLARNYGEAAAVDVLGRERGLPPAVSAHAAYAEWTDDGDLAATWLVVIGYPPAWLTRCDEGTLVAQIANRDGVANAEHGRWVATCHLDGGLASVWSDVVADRATHPHG